MLDADLASLCTSVLVNFTNHRGIIGEKEAHVHFILDSTDWYRFTWVFANENQPALFSIKNEQNQIVCEWSFTEYVWHLNLMLSEPPYDKKDKKGVLYFLQTVITKGRFYC